MPSEPWEVFGVDREGLVEVVLDVGEVVEVVARTLAFAAAVARFASSAVRPVDSSPDE